MSVAEKNSAFFKETFKTVNKIMSKNVFICKNISFECQKFMILFHYCKKVSHSLIGIGTVGV